MGDKPILLIGAGLACRAAPPYSPLMDTTPHHPEAPAEWLEALAESEADLAAGRLVPGDVVRRGLRESIARLETRQAARHRREATARG